MRSGNPVLKSHTFDIAPEGARMTLGGTVNKTAILLALVLITAIYTWGRFFSDRRPGRDHAAGVDRRHRRSRHVPRDRCSRRNGRA